MRYLESMIRMSEAFARMQLSENVSQADIDRAISVMATSFTSTQKIGAQRALERYLRKYLVFEDDEWELLLHLLRELVRAEFKWAYLRGREPSGVDVELFTSRAGEYGIEDLSGFFSCGVFNELFYLEDGRIFKKD